MPGGGIVVAPETGTASEVVVFYGGYGFATPDWILSQTPAQLLSTAVWVFVPCSPQNTYRPAETRLSEVLARAALGPLRRISVLGFSKGGIDALDAYAERQAELHFAGFIDPSLREEHLSLDFGERCGFMGVSSEMREFFRDDIGRDCYPELATRIRSAGSLVKEVLLPHTEYPAAFLSDPDFQRRLTWPGPVFGAAPVRAHTPPPGRSLVAFRARGSSLGAPGTGGSTSPGFLSRRPRTC
jgi:hypothetical protein